jgi:hypothetical protein
MQQQSNIEKMRAFYRDSIAGEKLGLVEVTAVNVEEFFLLCDKAGAASLANKEFIRAGAGNIRKVGFSLKHGSNIFYIYPPEHKYSGVAATSVAAYHTLNLPDGILRIARAAIEVQQKNGFCTDLLVSEHCGVTAAIISARRNDIENKFGFVEVDGVKYRLEWLKKTVRNKTGRGAKAWRLESGTLF